MIWLITAFLLLAILYSLAEWLGFALFLGCAVIGVPATINGAAYLAGAGPVVRWAAAVPIHSDGDATASLMDMKPIRAPEPSPREK
jgi:hypothetical protein